MEKKCGSACNCNQDHSLSLTFHQNIISRMNTNSFQIKGMLILLIVGFMVLCIGTGNLLLMGIAIIPTLGFWYLDADQYLKTERKVRKSYNAIVKEPSKYIPFVIDIMMFNEGEYSLRSVFFSKSILGFYGTIIVTLILIVLSFFFIK